MSWIPETIVYSILGLLVVYIAARLVTKGILTTKRKMKERNDGTQ